MAKAVNNKLNKVMWLRMLCVLLIMMLVMGVATGASLFNIMVIKGEEYQAKASEQQLYDTTLTAPRGDIYDVNMNQLATSANCWTVYLSPNNFKKITDAAKLSTVKHLIAENLSSILDVEYETLEKQMEKTGSYYVIIKRKVEKPEADKIRKFIADNKDYKLSNYIGLDVSTKRYYPNDNLASVVLGFVGDDNQGLAGIESYYDSELTGVPGRVVAAKNAQGVNMPFSYEKIIKAENGSSLVLTIDSYIQYVAEKYLSAAIEENLVANRGVSIVMNVKTGAILAMAIKGDFNPNTPFALSEADNELLTGLEGEERSKLLTELRNKQWRNKAVSDSYEPGSVFKIVTASAALEENVTNLNNKYNCPGYIVVAGQHYNCHKHSGHGVQNLNQAVSNSCNPVFITLGSLLGSKMFSKYFEAFGLTQKTGIDLPGEVTSIYHSEANMGPVELASSSFGQTFSTTPVQLISAVAAAVNGGYLVKPYLVSKVLDSEGNVKSTTTTTVKRQVISEETSKKICEMLENAVVSGGAKNAYVAGYKIGGKTGTSQKIAQMNATGQDNLYVSSFCGIAPMDNPEIAVLVLLDEPKGGRYYGSVVSAPVGGQILSEVLPYLGYEPQYSEEELNKLFVKVPDVASDTVEAAKQKIKTAGLSYKIVGDGETIEKQVPAANSSVSKNGLVVLYTEGSEKTQTKVPNFVGMTLSSVNDAAINAGVNVEFSGNAQGGGAVIAYTQSIAAETTVDYGTVVTVFFRDNSSADYATN